MTEITLNLTLKELQQIDKFVEVNDDTLSVLMKIKDAYPQQKSSVEEAYKEWMGEYPPTTPSVDNTNDIMWRVFQKGYEASKNNSEDISRVLIEGDDAYIMGVKYQRVEEPYCPDDPPEYDEIEWDEKDNPKPKTLRSIINRWWMDTFTSKNKWSVDECIDDLADQIEFFYMRNKK
jgi:hypothetical protein